MPELPEVETVAASLRGLALGRTVHAVETSGLALRKPVDREALVRATVGARLDSVERRAKYLVLGFSSGQGLLVHLGMSGRLTFAPAPAAVSGGTDADTARPAHTHVVLGLDAGHELRYVDARRFGIVLAAPLAEFDALPELASLGIDPLSPDFTAAHLERLLAESDRAIKDFLLDQARVAGIGNIYAAEALHVAGISPRRRSSSLGPVRAARLHEAIVSVLAASVARRGTSLRDYVDANGFAGDNQRHLHVYGREGEPCRRCGATVRRLVQGARSTFYCGACQR